jgi:Flp pilus assembly protein CpaB
MLKTIAIPERARNIAIAVAVAGFAAMLTAFYVSNYKRHVQQDQKNVPVLVAGRTIDAGTPGSEVLEKKLAVVKEMPRRSVVNGSFSSLDQIESLISTEKIYAGEQVTARRFSPLRERGVRAKLDGNLRAIEVVGKRSQVLAGTLREGDRVDVLANFASDEISSGGFTRTIMRDILVVRGANSGDGAAVTGDSDEAAVQLALTDAQAQKLYFAMENASDRSGTGWWLTIRPVNNASDSPESIETYWTMLKDGLKVSQIRRAYGMGVRP